MRYYNYLVLHNIYTITWFGVRDYNKSYGIDLAIREYISNNLAIVFVAIIDNIIFEFSWLIQSVILYPFL